MDNPLETLNQDSSVKKNPLDELNRDELKQKCKGLLAIAQKAKQAKSEIENEIENYKTLFHKYESEKRSTLEKVQTLQELVDSLTEQKLNYITEVDAAQVKIKTLNGKCKHHEEEIRNYKAELIIKDNHAADMAQKLSNLDSEVISLKRQHNRLLDENEQLISQLTELEAQTTQFNNIGLEQREQLKLLEDKIKTENSYKEKIEELNDTIKELKSTLQSNEENLQTKHLQVDYENKIREITEMYESEKSKKEKANVKLRSYKDKILKCAACINQLKNSRFILSKTVKDYSENIPKWQNDIINASKVLDTQINQLNNENSSLKEKLFKLEKQFKDLQVSQNEVNEMQQNSPLTKMIKEHELLQSEISNLQNSLQHTTDNNKILEEELIKLKLENDNKNIVEKQQRNKYDTMSQKNRELNILLEKLKSENDDLRNSIQNHTENSEFYKNMSLKIKALESEKGILVKEKLNARDSVIEFENENKLLKKRTEDMRSEIQIMKSEIESLLQQKTLFENKFKTEKEDEMNNMKCQMIKFKEQYDLLKKEYDNLQDLNGLLKEEVDTLKLSLEQPKDDTDNLSDLNVSLQADLVKLETKLSAYKQENASLLAEIKESRVKCKEFDTVAAEYEEAKSKLSGYKTENAELLNEMKEINQVLKERGEAISKLQKAIAELERLVETLEKDRETTNQERDDLNKKNYVLRKDLENAELKTEKSNAAAEQVTIERNNALKVVAEKDIIITSLHEEIEKFKQQQISHELPHEDMSTSTISKAEEHSRMKDLDETFEEKYTKLRLFALKLKKKLNETTTQLQNAEQDKAKLEKLLQENDSIHKKPTLTASSDEIDGFNKKSEDTVNQVKITDLQAKLMNLMATVEASEQKTAELEKLQVALDNKTKELTAEVEAHKVTKENLEKARRDAKKKNVLSLEMEDYERSMKELTVKMEEAKKKMVQMESTIDTQEGTITAMKTQIKLLEEQIKSEETQSRLTKEELQHAIEEGKEKENVVQIKNGVISKLEQDLEDEKRKNEESDLDTTALISEKEKVIMALGEDKAELNNKVKRLEFKCSELIEKLRITNIELADLKTEYTSYKVRAQAVLRQNQTVDHSQEERLKEEAAALKAHIETMTLKVSSTTEQCSELSAEAENLRRRAAEAAGEAARAQQRTARLQADLTRIGQQLDSERTHHKLQVSTLTQCYKTQISELEERLQKEIEALKKQLANQETIKTGKNVDELNQNQYMLPVIPKDEICEGEMDINVSLIPREEGEGSESAPSPPPSKPYLTGGGSGRSPVPLERLLEEGVPEDEALDTESLALTPDQEMADLRRRLQAQQQRVKHVTVLLSESEREGARLAQLSDLLKAELRRVRAATHNVHNTEYMKNVTLKFLTLAPGDERSRLVPVLQKILTLTPDETLKIQALAKGQDPNASKGWGSYLPWPGGK